MPTTVGKATEFITFSRGTLATVVDSDGKVKWAPHNLLSASEQFDASSWTNGAQVTLSANAAVAPNGTTTAERYSTSDGVDSSLNNILQQVSTGPATVTAGVWLRSAIPQTVKLAIMDSTTVITNTSLSVTSTWTLFTITGTVPTGSATVWRVRPDGTNAISNLEIWGAHLYRSDLGGMQANASAYPYYNPTTPKNLLGYSEDFTASSWVKNNASIGGNGVELVTNGTFDTDTSGWTFQGTATDTSSAGFLSGTTGPASNLLAHQVITTVAGKTYRIDITTGPASTAVYLSPTTAGGVTLGSTGFVTNGSKTLTFVATSATTYLSVMSVGVLANASLDNISVQEVATYASPNGSNNALAVEALSANGTLTQSLSLLASPYTYSIWLKRKTGSGNIQLTVDGSTYSTVAVTSDWQRFSTTLTPSAGTKTPGIRLVTSGDAVYAWGAQLSDSASLDPYSPVFGAAPSAAAYHGPRLDYDGDTLAAKGLLVEEARTNNLLYSNTFDNAYYTSTARATALPNSGTSPDGTNNAYKLQEDNTLSSTHLVGRAVVADTQAAANYCASVFVKKAGRTQARLRLTDNATTEMFIVVNLEDGTVVSSGAGTFTNFDRDVQDYGNGWYRIWIAGTKPNATFQSGWAVYPAVAGSITYDGNGTDGIYIYGGCIENGLFPTSYIPTTTATVTRNADVASVATSQFPYSATEGTIVAAFDVIGVNNLNQRIVSLDESTGNTGVFATKANATLVWQVFTGGAEQATLSTSNSSINATVKTACAFKDNDFAASTNGASPQTDPSGTVGTSTQLSIGMRFAKDNQLNGHIRQITYIPRRLTNAELQSRTA